MKFRFVAENCSSDGHSVLYETGKTNKNDKTLPSIWTSNNIWDIHLSYPFSQRAYPLHSTSGTRTSDLAIVSRALYYCSTRDRRTMVCFLDETAQAGIGLFEAQNKFTRVTVPFPKGLHGCLGSGVKTDPLFST